MFSWHFILATLSTVSIYPRQVLNRNKNDRLFFCCCSVQHIRLENEKSETNKKEEEEEKGEVKKNLRSNVLRLHLFIFQLKEISSRFLPKICVGGER